MLTTRDLIGGFASTWKEILPWLTPSVIGGLQARRRQLGPPIVSSNETDSRLNDLIAEYGYQIAAAAHARHRECSDIVSDAILNQSLKFEAGRRLAGLSAYNSAAAQLSPLEDAEALSIAVNIRHYIVECGESFIFGRFLPGRGAIGEQQIDLDSTSRIVEIKSVTRDLRSRDFRQIFLYVALQSQYREARWQKASLFNPRQNNVYEFDIDALFYELAGGRPPVLVIQEFLQMFEKTPFRLSAP